MSAVLSGFSAAAASSSTPPESAMLADVSSPASPIGLRAPVSVGGAHRNGRLERVGHYRLGTKLGSGNFAKVRVGTHEVAKSKVAVKIINRNSLDAENLLKVEREIQILQSISHPHIIKLYEVIRTEKHLFIVTELVNGGELFDLLMYNGRQAEGNARRIFQQLVSAVAYCHANGIVHRDLKAENVLLDKEGNVKLIDFGFSNYQKSNVLLSTWCGSPPYAAPELLLAQEYNGKMSDVWSLGVVLFILVTAEFPFQGGTVDNLKMAVLGELLNIPFFVSVECADLLRKMLTVNPEKRATLNSVMQHRWFIAEMDAKTREVLSETALRRKVFENKVPLNVTPGATPSSAKLDPTVMLFMQQHTIWSEEKITEDVIVRNYESPVFATYELLNDKLAKVKDADAALKTDYDQPRRGSRGSILSGKANVEPAPTSTTIPAHHLAQLSLSASSDFESDEDSSASDIGMGEEPGPSSAKQNPLRRKMRRAEAATDHRRHTLCASERVPLVPMPNKPRTADENAWAELTAQYHNHHHHHQHNHGHQQPAQAAGLVEGMLHHQPLQLALQLAEQHQAQLIASQHPNLATNPALMNLIGLGNGLIDYSRMIRLPTGQERRASANEASLGLNGYAHLLAACSSMTAQPAAAAAASASSPNSSPISGKERRSSNSRVGSRPRVSVEEEGALYLNRQGTHKRNTVHSLASPFAPLPFQRHPRTPYAKGMTAAVAQNERRSSWASPTNLNAQNLSRLESIYAQSVRANGAQDRHSLAGSEHLMSIQQLQMEFQKLQAAADSNGGSASGSQQNAAGVVKAPTISITDENNCSLPPTSASYDLSFMGSAQAVPNDPNSSGNPRPATVIGFSPTSPAGSPGDGRADAKPVRYVFIPVSVNIALDRIYRFVREQQFVCEVRQIAETEDSIEVRIAPTAETIVSLIIHKLPESPNISKTEFAVVQGTAADGEALRQTLMALFNEVY